ncbi:MAG: hypothetical protein SFZ03_02715 [Candidatus Melainabacteria bacterium]|nr:hypothetical protein [Candidatus Melainabacteria bacterium]
MILIIGHRDEHTQRVEAHLETLGQRVIYWNTQSFPAEASLSLHLGDFSQSCLELHQERLFLSDIEGVYWYHYHGVRPGSRTTDPEADVSLLNLFRSWQTNWVNPPASVMRHRLKIYQLQQVAQLGIRTPHTLVSNDIGSLQSFCEQMGGTIISKNYTGIGIPQKLTSASLASNLQADSSQRSMMPAIFQEYIQGLDIRIHAIGDALFATELHTQDWTFVLDRQVELRATSVPDDLAEQCQRIIQRLGLVFSGLDFRRTQTGEYVFIEANPSPQFGAYEAACHYPISEHVAKRLCGKHPNYPTGPSRPGTEGHTA